MTALGGAPRPVALDRARIDRQIRELALEHATGNLEDEVYLDASASSGRRRTTLSAPEA